jgi:CDP-diacylglycerol---glycerol-3-phosphate 3-phosphatidyltransferase
MMEQSGFEGHIWAFFLTIFLISLDAIDGIVARWLKETSEVGGVFDIVADRIVENCFWIYFAAKGSISFWIPFIIISRGILTDDIRGVALTKGMTAFGEKTLQKSAIGKALVSSRWSRGLYGLSKMLAFLSLISIQGMSMPGSENFIAHDIQNIIRASGYAIVYITVGYCILRGVPVILDSIPFLFPKHNSKN